MKKILLIMLTAILMVGVVSCDNKVSSSGSLSSSENYTQEELFNEWKKGKDYTLNYKGEYTSYLYEETYKDSELMGKSDVYQTYNDGMTLIENNVYMSKNNKLELVNYSKQAIKKVNDNGKERTKLYQENGNGSNKNVRGEYIKISQAKQMNYYSPESFLEGLELSGNNYNDFIKNLKSSFNEIDEVKVDLLFSKENEIINFSISFEYEYVDDSIKDQDYLKSDEYGIMILSCKDNKIIETIYDYKTKLNYKDETNNYEIKDTRKGNIDYQFDKEKYNKFSVETETTTYNDGEYINYFVGDYPFIFSQQFDFNETFTENDGIEFLANHNNFIIRGQDDDVSSYISLYLDKELTKPFTSITLNEEITLYVKFNMPSDKSLVICVMQNESYTRLALIYLVDVGNTFRTNYRFPYNDVISIDGKEVDNNTNLDFVINDNTIHTVIYAGN